MKLNTEDYPCIDKGSGKPMLILHGLFGDTSNWTSVIDHFSSDFRILAPELPVYKGEKKHLGMMGLFYYIEEFVALHELDEIVLLGNSLGGHIALIYALNHPERIHKMVLTGSSGLYENTAGTSIIRRSDYEYVKDRVGYSFYAPDVVGDSFVRRIFDRIGDNNVVLRIIHYARAAKQHNLSTELHKIEVPTLLIWGLNDPITPPSVCYEFFYKLPQAQIEFIDKCCHAPMMEHPKYFNELVKKFVAEEVLI